MATGSRERFALLNVTVNVMDTPAKPCPHGYFPEDGRTRPMIIFPEQLSADELSTLLVSYLLAAIIPLSLVCYRDG